jgi:hypothetical protein
LTKNTKNKKEELDKKKSLQKALLGVRKKHCNIVLFIE